MQGGGGKKWLLMDTGFFWGWWKYPISESGDDKHDSVTILETTEMYFREFTFALCLLWDRKPTTDGVFNVNLLIIHHPVLQETFT